VVDGPEAVRGDREGGLHVGLLLHRAEIEGHPVLFAEVLGGHVDVVFADVEDDDLAALFQHGGGDVLAHAAGATGDEHGLAVEIGDRR
jgi:hypothetical protein